MATMKEMGLLLETLAKTLEEARAVLADKARKGFRSEVKALLTAHGAKQLSDITDPAELGALALLRVANPEASLSDLAMLSDPPVTKSCINHRLRKLMNYKAE